MARLTSYSCRLALRVVQKERKRDTKQETGKVEKVSEGACPSLDKLRHETYVFRIVRFELEKSLGAPSNETEQVVVVMTHVQKGLKRFSDKLCGCGTARKTDE